MVIVGVGAAGCPGSVCTRPRDSHWAQSSSRVDARKWQPVGLFGAPRPLFTIVRVCVHCRPPSYVLGSRIPGESCHGVSHLGSSLDPPASTRGRAGQMPRDGARMGGGSAGHQSGCKLAWHGMAGPSTASETLTAGMSKGSSSRIEAGFRLGLD